MTPQDLKLLHDQLNNVTPEIHRDNEIIDRACDALLAYADLLQLVQNLIETGNGKELDPHVAAYDRLKEMVK